MVPFGNSLHSPTTASLIYQEQTVIIPYVTNTSVTAKTTKEQANKKSSGPWEPATRQWIKEDIYELLTQECVVWATMKGTRRTNEAIETITLVTVDFDEPPNAGMKPFEHMRQVRAAMDRLKINYAMKPTNSHQVDKKGITCDRFRVVIPLQSPMPVHEIGRIKEWALALFPDSDSSAFVVSRYWFRCPEDKIFMFFDGGEYLDWAALPGAAKSVECTTQRKNLPATHRVQLETGEYATLGDIQARGKKVKVHCPNVNHKDRNPSAFVGITSIGRLYISCSVCEAELRDNCNTRSWWLESETESSVIDEWNMAHAKIMHGGKDLVIVEHHDGDFDMIPSGAFHSHNCDETVEVLSAGAVKRQPATRIWYSHPQARKYGRLVIKPADTYLQKGEYNAWRGYGVPRVTDTSISIEPILDHIYTVVCDENKMHYEWLMAWIAQMYQNPVEKPGTAIMVYGLQGSGKSVLSKILQKLWHPKHVLIANTSEQFLGRFNSHLEYTVLVACEEAVWARSGKDSDKLKDLITGNELMVEPKGRQIFKCKNHLRIFGTTNREFSVPAGIGERRWLVLDCNNKYADCRQHPNREEYFSTLFKAIKDNRVVGRLLDHVLSLDYSTVNLSSAPKTVALARSQSQNLDDVPQWYFDCLAGGQLLGLEVNDWPKEVAISEVYGAFIQYCKNSGIRPPFASLITFGRTLKTYGIKKKRRSAKHDRSYMYAFPPLNHSKEIFFEKMGMFFPEGTIDAGGNNEEFSLVGEPQTGDKEESKPVQLFKSN